MAEVDTDSLINQAIEARAGREGQRRNLALQRRSIIDQLGATRPRDKGRIHALRAQLSGLDIGDRELMSRDRNDQQLLGIQVSSAFRNANMAHKLSTDALNLRTAQEAGEVFNGFADLMSRTKPGTQAFRDGMTALKDKYPLGFAAEAVKGHLGQIAQFHDKEAEQNQKMLATKLFKDHSISPAQFATYTNDRATNVPVLVNAKGEEDLKNGKPPTHDQIEKLRSNDGSTVAADIGGRTFLFKRDLFDNLKSTFGPNRPTDTSVVPATPDQQAQAAGYRSAEQAQGYREGNPILDYAPPGTATTERSLPMQSGPTPSGGFASTGKIQPNQLSANDNRTATLPMDVQPNQVIQHVTQIPPQLLDAEPMNQPQVAAAQPTATPEPQVAQQPTATPHPMEGQAVRNKSSGQMGTIVNGIFVPNQQ